jgi:hypothetical protein
MPTDEDAVDVILRQWGSVRPDLDAAPMGVAGRLSRAARLLERGLERDAGGPVVRRAG